MIVLPFYFLVIAIIFTAFLLLVVGFVALYQSVKFRIEQLSYHNSSVFNVIHSLTAFNGEGEIISLALC